MIKYFIILYIQNTMVDIFIFIVIYNCWLGNAKLAEKFAPVTQALKDNEAIIIEELLSVEGKAQDIGGYYNPNEELAEKAMRPSATLNGIIDGI